MLSLAEVGEGSYSSSVHNRSKGHIGDIVSDIVLKTKLRFSSFSRHLYFMRKTRAIFRPISMPARHRPSVVCLVAGFIKGFQYGADAVRALVRSTYAYVAQFLHGEDAEGGKPD